MRGESMRYSLRNIEHRKGRSFLTVFSILIGIATIFIFISFGAGLYNYVDELTSSSSANKLMIQSKGGFGGIDENFELNDDDLGAVERAGDVKSATGIYFKTTKVELREEQIYTFLISYDPQNPLIMDVFNIGIFAGRGLQKGDSGKVVLGYNYQTPGKIFEKGLGVNDNI